MVDERSMDGWMIHFGLDNSAHIHSSLTPGDREAALDSQCPIPEEVSRHGRQPTGDGTYITGTLTVSSRLCSTVSDHSDVDATGASDGHYYKTSRG